MKSKWIYGITFASIASFACLQAQAAEESGQASAATPAVQETANPTASAKPDGATFMQENKNKPDVVTLPSGLQYKIIEVGSGKKPSKSDTVTVDYKGTLLDGRVFDSSYDRGQPATFP